MLYTVYIFIIIIIII